MITPAQQIVLQDYIDAVTDAERRVDRVTRQISEHLPGWSLAPVATAIQAPRQHHSIATVRFDPIPRFDRDQRRRNHRAGMPKPYARGWNRKVARLLEAVPA